jgi:hypothetical protein
LLKENATLKQTNDALNERTAELEKNRKRLYSQNDRTTKKLQKELQTKEEENSSLTEELAVKTRQHTQARNYRKTVAQQKRGTEQELRLALDENEALREAIDGVEGAYEKLQVEYAIMAAEGNRSDDDDSYTTEELKVFDNGQFDDRIRLAVFACMRANVGKDRIGPLIEAIMRAMVNKRFDRMPKPSTIASWATQFSGVSLAHVFDQLTRDQHAVKVIAHDGTTKNGKKYGTGRYVTCVRAYACACRDARKVLIQRFVCCV